LLALALTLTRHFRQGGKEVRGGKSRQFRRLRAIKNTVSLQFSPNPLKLPAMNVQQSLVFWPLTLPDYSF